MRGRERRVGRGTTKRIVLFVVAVALAAPASALAETRHVSVRDNSFPFRVLALTGDTVTWRNEGGSVHNVTSSQFPSSPDLGPGESFSHVFAAAGSYQYHCTKHIGMSGNLSVRDLHLSGPATPVAYGGTATVTGLAPSGAAVQIKRGTDTVGTATAAADGRFTARFPAGVPGQYYATAGDGKTSSAVALRVRPRISLSTRRSGGAVYVNVSTNPAQVGASVVLQRRTGSGWARVASARLNSRSKATFRVVLRTTTTLRVQLARGVQGYSASTSAPKTVRR